MVAVAAKDGENAFGGVAMKAHLFGTVLGILCTFGVDHFAHAGMDDTTEKANGTSSSKVLTAKKWWEACKAVTFIVAYSAVYDCADKTAPKQQPEKEEKTYVRVTIKGVLRSEKYSVWVEASSKQDGFLGLHPWYLTFENEELEQEARRLKGKEVIVNGDLSILSTGYTHNGRPLLPIYVTNLRTASK
jgi:hypothetical protein